MKRESWQHGGAARASRSKLLRLVATDASGGTVARCHDHSVAKGRDVSRAKGAHKLRSCDVALNHRLASWRVVDGAGACAGSPDYKGASASAVLAYLAGGNSWHEEEEEEEDDDGDGGDSATTPSAKPKLSDLYDLLAGHHVGARAPTAHHPDLAHANDIAVVDSDATEEQELDANGDEEDEDMGFFMVGITTAVELSDGEDDWIVVEEIPSACPIRSD